MTRRSDAGMALLLVMFALILVSALGTALVLTTSTEVMIAGNFRASIEARYAAEAIAERVVDELASQRDWQPVLDGAARSTFADGEPYGQRELSDGTLVNLADATGRIAGGRLYAYGFLGRLDSGPAPSPSFYLMAIVGPGRGDPGRLLILAEAIGVRGVRRAVEVVLTRNDETQPPEAFRVLSWHPVR